MDHLSESALVTLSEPNNFHLVSEVTYLLP
jgi:hypothetical protein